jgi:hypothetical protein
MWSLDLRELTFDSMFEMSILITSFSTVSEIVSALFQNLWHSQELFDFLPTFKVGVYVIYMVTDIT